MISLPIALFFLVSTSPSQGRFVSEDITFASGSLTLAGTIRHPIAPSRAPAVVLVHGSGRTDRTSLRYFAEAFERLGVATLVYDKRGVGKSEGPDSAWRNFSIEDLAQDAAAALRYLRSRADIDSSRIGLFGASQGGWVAPRAAELDARLRFLVLVSASVSTIAEDNLFERDARIRAEGFSEDAVREVHAMHLVDLDVSRNGTRYDEFARLWEANRDKPWFRRVYLGQQPAGPESAYRQWYRTVMDFDPVPILRHLDEPTLWLYGDPDLDHFAPVRLSLERLEQLRTAGKRYEVESFRGADHSLQLKGGGEVPFGEVLATWLPGVLR